MSKHVTLKQIEMLTSIMEQHRDLALKRPNCTEERAEATRLWAKIAEILNAKSVKGAVRSPKEWTSFFHLYKYRIRKKALKAEQTKPTNISSILSPLQKRFCAILWPEKYGNENAFDGYDVSESSVDNMNSTTNLFETVTKIHNFKEETLPVSSDNEDYEQMDLQSRYIPKPGRSNQSENTNSVKKGIEKTWDALADLEKTRLEISKAKLEALLERNALEREKNEIFKELSGAAWALVNMMKNTNEVGNVS